LTELSSGGVADPEVTASDEDFTMQSWLDSQTDFRTLRRGEVVEGTIMAIQRDGVLVDLGAKSEGLIPPHEMHSLGADPLSKVQVDEKILVYVMQPEADQGQIMLSVDRARGERGWRVLQQRYEEGEAFDAEVTGSNKGGLLVNVTPADPLTLAATAAIVLGTTAAALALPTARALDTQILRVISD